jgi:quercetin dioxygenase-like cupin family protein
MQPESQAADALGKALTPQISDELIPRPDSDEFDVVWIGHLQRLGVPVVGIGRRWAPFLPQVRPPSPDAPELIELDRDMERVARERDWWAQPWSPRVVTKDSDVPDILRRAELFEQSLGPWRPGQRPSMQMTASASARLDLHSHQRIAETIGLRGTATHTRDVMRFRSMPRVIEAGDRLWAALGAWPWATFDPDPPPQEWWTDQRAQDAIRRLIEHAAREADAAAEIARERASSLRRLGARGKNAGNARHLASGR